MVAWRLMAVTIVEYRDVPDFPGYRVGSDGTVWSIWKRRTRKTGREWTQLNPASRGGYPRLLLRDKDGTVRRVRLSRLVLTVFTGPCPVGMEACHDPDPTPSNCRLDNLRWDTRAGNMADKAKQGRSQIGELHGGHRLTEADVVEIWQRLPKESMRSIAKSKGVYWTTIRQIRDGISWRWLTSKLTI